jgi:general secretion pathway protein F
VGAFCVWRYRSVLRSGSIAAPFMSTATLDDFMLINEQLDALVEAGVPIDIDLGQRGTSTAEVLEKINATIARRVSQGTSLNDAIASEERVATPSYRALLQLGLRTGDLSTALNVSSRFAESIDESRHALRFSFLYPAIVCCFAYVGLVAFCLFFVPRLESMYQNLQIRPGAGLPTLQALRRTLPFWIAVPPLAFVLLALWLRARSRQHSFRAGAISAWLPQMPRAVFRRRAAGFAEIVAALLDDGLPLTSALEIAADAWNDTRMHEATRGLAASLKQGQTPSDDGRLASQFPPLLRWALWHSATTTGTAPALRMAANVYRQASDHYIERLRTLAPMVMCVVLGGSVTLLYGLALFVPFVDLLLGLASGN